MSTYPESPKPIYPLIIEPEWKTIISGFDGGGEQRRQKQLFPKYNVSVQYDALSETDMQTLWDFYMARKGSFEAFYIYDLALLASIALNHDGQYVGTGDGATDIFDIPGRSTSSQAVYIDNALQTTPTNYSILTGGGESSSDRIDFVAAPAAGEVITVDFTGYLRIRARFLEDKLPRELFMTSLFRYGIKLKGLSAA